MNERTEKQTFKSISLQKTQTHPVLDPVEGRYREHAPRDRAPADRAVARLKSAVLNDPDLLDVLLRGATVRDRPAWLDGTRDRFPSMPAATQSAVRAFRNKNRTQTTSPKPKSPFSIRISSRLAIWSDRERMRSTPTPSGNVASKACAARCVAL